jgi:phage shock protein PspC (stress-responsive transcriptional regulator)
MNKVITIHLNGVAFQLEEGGFDALRAYLDTAARRLGGNPDKDEILADIEQAIADKFRSLLGASKTVIITKEATDIIEAMGPVDDSSGSAEEVRPSAGPSAASAQPGPGATPGPAPHAPKRLYKIREGSKIGGVCNGIAAYLNADVTIVRIAFALFGFVYGSGILIYLLLMFVLPEANTPEEMDEAHGTPSATAQEFIRRAREGYYEGMKSFGDRRAHREWRKKFKKDMRSWGKDFQRDMRSNWGRQWNWPGHHPGTYPPPGAYPPPGVYRSHGFINLLLSLVSIFYVIAIISFVTTGGILGVYFPGMPIWLGILLIIAVVKIVKWPLRAMRGSYYYGDSWHCWNPFGFIWHALMWVLLVYAIIWLFGGHVAGMHEIGQHMPHKLHSAAESIKEWWDNL